MRSEASSVVMQLRMPIPFGERVYTSRFLELSAKHRLRHLLQSRTSNEQNAAVTSQPISRSKVVL
ncbi:hypothetical protein X749_30025 [Mesorhizobium sp. LNJC391B00]|nr:hypothetical protein X749_30025 [Mesorhizobium sp. LNJC391B00]